jgi:hypothetical protein
LRKLSTRWGLDSIRTSNIRRHTSAARWVRDVFEAMPTILGKRPPAL